MEYYVTRITPTWTDQGLHCLSLGSRGCNGVKPAALSVNTWQATSIWLIFNQFGLSPCVYCAAGGGQPPLWMSLSGVLTPEVNGLIQPPGWDLAAILTAATGAAVEVWRVVVCRWWNAATVSWTHFSTAARWGIPRGQGWWTQMDRFACFTTRQCLTVYITSLFMLCEHVSLIAHCRDLMIVYINIGGKLPWVTVLRLGCKTYSTPIWFSTYNSICVYSKRDLLPEKVSVNLNVLGVSELYPWSGTA